MRLVVNCRHVVREAGKKRIGGGGVSDAALVGRDTRNFPATDGFVDIPGNMAGKLTATTEGQLSDEVCRNDVGRVEVRRPAADAWMKHIADESGAVGRGVRDQRNVIDRVRPGVVEVELRALRKILRESKKQTVVGREALVGEVGTARKLRSYTDIRGKKGVGSKCLNDIGDITQFDGGVEGRSHERGVVSEPVRRAVAGCYYVGEERLLGNVCRSRSAANLRCEGGERLAQRLTRYGIGEVDQLGSIGLAEKAAAFASDVVRAQNEVTRELLLDTNVEGDVIRILEVWIDDEIAEAAGQARDRSRRTDVGCVGLGWRCNRRRRWKSGESRTNAGVVFQRTRGICRYAVAERGGVLEEERVLILQEVDSVCDGAVVHDVRRGIKHSPRRETRIVGDRNAGGEVFRIRLIEVRSTIGMAAQAIRKQRQGSVPAGARRTLLDARRKVVVEANVGNGLRTECFVGNRVQLVPQPVGERQFLVDLPGIADIELDLVITVATVCPGTTGLLRSAGVEVVHAGNAAHTTESQHEGIVILRGVRSSCALDIRRAKCRRRGAQASYVAASSQRVGVVVAAEERRG